MSYDIMDWNWNGNSKSYSFSRQQGCNSDDDKTKMIFRNISVNFGFGELECTMLGTECYGKISGFAFIVLDNGDTVKPWIALWEINQHFETAVDSYLLHFSTVNYYKGHQFTELTIRFPSSSMKTKFLETVRSISCGSDASSTLSSLSTSTSLSSPSEQN